MTKLSRAEREELFAKLYKQAMALKPDTQEDVVTAILFEAKELSPRERDNLFAAVALARRSHKYEVEHLYRTAEPRNKLLDEAVGDLGPWGRISYQKYRAMVENAQEETVTTLRAILTITPPDTLIEALHAASEGWTNEQRDQAIENLIDTRQG